MFAEKLVLTAACMIAVPVIVYFSWHKCLRAIDSSRNSVFSRLSSSRKLYEDAVMSLEESRARKAAAMIEIDSIISNANVVIQAMQESSTLTMEHTYKQMMQRSNMLLETTGEKMRDQFCSKLIAASLVAIKHKISDNDHDSQLNDQEAHRLLTKIDKQNLH